MNLTDTTDLMEDSSCQMLIKSPNAVKISRNFFNVEYDINEIQFFFNFPDHVNFWLFGKNENFVYNMCG